MSLSPPGFPSLHLPFPAKRAHVVDEADNDERNDENGRSGRTLSQDKNPHRDKHTEQDHDAEERESDDVAITELSESLDRVPHDPHAT